VHPRPAGRHQRSRVWALQRGAAACTTAAGGPWVCRMQSTSRRRTSRYAVYPHRQLTFYLEHSSVPARKG
jgi:hypothetical protein